MNKKLNFTIYLIHLKINTRNKQIEFKGVET